MTSVPPRPVQSSRYYAEGMTIAGKYELVRPLGEGGMGSVWVARNVALESHVALKLLRADFDAEDAGERLLLEARAAARLGHRAIVRIFDFGHTSQGDPFIVMELLEGETVASLVAARGRLAPAKAVQMILPVLDALSAAHGRGIVHRDLKPENIFLARETRRTQPKIVDFGIAKLDQGAAAVRNLTLQGTVLGSPGYMSPEQARGSSAIDHRADIWAACVVVYECVTAQSAFQGDNYNSLMRAIIEERVVPITELAAGDASLWAILEKGLQKDPNERWQSARELGVAFVEWLLAHGIETDIAGEPVRGWLEPDSSKSRDLLSVPPASIALQSDRSGLNVTRGDTPPAAPSSFRPSPESTSAVVRTSRPQFSTRVPFAAAVLLLVLGAVIVITLATRGHTTASASASSPVVAGPAPRAPEPAAAKAVTPEPRPVSPGPAVEPNTTGLQSVAQPPTKAQPAPRAARRPPPQKPGAPPSGKAGPDLKDPY